MFSSSSATDYVLLIVYVNDIIITGIQRLKHFLRVEFCPKDIGRLPYFLEIKVAYSGSFISLSQRKYVLDILDEIGYLEVKPVASLMDPNVRLNLKHDDLL